MSLTPEQEVIHAQRLGAQGDAIAEVVENEGAGGGATESLVLYSESDAALGRMVWDGVVDAAWSSYPEYDVEEPDGWWPADVPQNDHVRLPVGSYLIRATCSFAASSTPGKRGICIRGLPVENTNEGRVSHYVPAALDTVVEASLPYVVTEAMVVATNNYVSVDVFPAGDEVITGGFLHILKVA